MRLIKIVLTVFFVMGFISACSVQQVKDELNHGEIPSVISKAEQGDADAQYNLGLMYGRGVGVPKNYIKSYLWWSLLSAQGYEHAKHNIDILTKKMTPEQIAQAQKEAAELWEKMQK